MTSDNGIEEVIKLYGHYAPPKGPYPKPPHGNASAEGATTTDRRHGDSTPHNQHLNEALIEFSPEERPSQLALNALSSVVKSFDQDPDIRAALINKRARRYVETDTTGRKIPHKEYQLITEDNDDLLAATKALKGFLGNNKQHYYDDVREILRATQREIETQHPSGEMPANFRKLHGYCSLALFNIKQALEQSIEQSQNGRSTP